MTLSPLAAVVPQHAIRFAGHDTHQHELPHLVHVVSGRAHLTTGDQTTYRLAAGESVWLAARVPHAVRVSEGGLVLGPLLDAEDAPPGPVMRLPVLSEVSRVATVLLGAAPTTEAQIAPFRRALGEALRAACARYFPLVEPRHPVAHAIARDALRGPDTLERLARRHHMSARQVQRLFLAETGLAFARWRTRARLNSAIPELLAGTPATLAAARAGYTTRSGLLRALARECEVDADVLRRDPRLALSDRVA
ncbi:Cupin domain-containing protein [Streptomyces zhaozhouensis]|uniref:Cupin domain-containing protein n=1 Tax=Streptomyces zhaozhouensis TaxID=1300267 RepID=A0A286E0K4_9ACTN|nr:AraC family transcriptional regulator [Streptomyces zhaozhouensis]SOD64400.1 Cupin domain-containing protein [Streptomyces zhaozhouensis]